MPADVKIRYKDPGTPAYVNPFTESESAAEVIFSEPVRAITPGQSAVIYEGDEVVAGGWINTVGV
jgi:tRNA-specific 2-thiouridylase